MNTALSFIPLLARASDRLLSLFYPEVCQICREQRATFAECYLCQPCRRGKDAIKWVEAPFCDTCGLPFQGDITVQFECANCREQKLQFRSARAAVEFSGVIKEVIHRYKYNHAAWFEPLLGELLVNAAGPSLAPTDWDYIVPIPLHWLRRRDRTFNQSERIARRLSRATGIPLRTRLLKRIQPTHTQTRLSRAERTENVKRAFAFTGREPIAAARIILVDDVLTTGATASACAKLLKQNGAAVVDVWTVARGILK
jgi:ComF family protein